MSSRSLLRFLFCCCDSFYLNHLFTLINSMGDSRHEAKTSAPSSITIDYSLDWIQLIANVEIFILRKPDFNEAQDLKSSMSKLCPSDNKKMYVKIKRE